MTETRHVKLNYEEALNAKKQLLSTELNILHIVKRVKTYKVLRKRELANKNKIKTLSKSLNTKLNLLLSTLPDENGEPRTTKKTRGQRKKQEKKEDLTEELADIEKKLAKLG